MFTMVLRGLILKKKKRSASVLQATVAEQSDGSLFYHIQSLGWSEDGLFRFEFCLHPLQAEQLAVQLQEMNGKS